MKRIFLFSISFILIATSFAFSQDIIAKTKDGYAVILRKNGSWIFYDPSINPKQKDNFPEGGVIAVTSNGLIFILKKDGTWILTNNSAQQFQFSNPKPQNPKVMQLAQSGHGHEEYWEVHKSMLGKTAPELELYDWMNGSFPQKTWRGRIVVVNFWATWCGPCRRAIPYNNTIFEKYKDQGVLIIGACGSSGQDKMANVAIQAGLKYPTAKVPVNYINTWNVFYWPTYAIIDRNGILRAIGVSSNYIERIIQALLQE